MKTAHHTIGRHATRAAELAEEIDRLSAIRRAQDTASPTWAMLTTRIDGKTAEWLAWQSDGPTLARIERQIRAAATRESRAHRAATPWPYAAAGTGAMGGLLGLNWFWFDTPAWMPISALLCLASAAAAVVLTARDRRASQDALAAAQKQRADLQAELATLIDRHKPATQPASAPATA